MKIARTVGMLLLSGAALGIGTGPSMAYRESLQPNGQRFDLLSELSSLGEEKPLLLQTCGVGGPNQVEAKTIRQYFDRSSQAQLWIITTPARKDTLFYSSNDFVCTILQQ